MTGIRYQVEDPVGLITLDRPEPLNALTPVMLRAFREAVEIAAADPAVVGIVITGAGRGFWSGLDTGVLAAMSDLRIASSAASFTTIFSKRCLVAEHGTSWIVPRLVGAGAALDLLWSARRIDAAEALRIGLVQQVVQPDDLLAAARRYVEASV